MPEEWRPVAKHAGYEVSNRGRVRSLNRFIYDQRRNLHRLYPGRILTPVINGGYPRVKLGGAHNGIAIHRLVTEAFTGPCPANQEVRHKNGIKIDNRTNNLFYGTRRDNAQDRIKHGHQVDKRGVLHHNVRLTEPQVRTIRRSKKSLAVLAARYSVSPQQISKIKLRQRWRHLSR